VAEHVWSVLCSSSSTDRETRVVSLFNVITYLTIIEPVDVLRRALEAKVLLPIQMELWSLWVRSDYAKPEMAIARYRVITPAGEELSQMLVNVPLEEFPSAHTKLRISAFPFRGPGVYWWVVETRSAGESVEWGTVARIPVELEQQEPISSPVSPEQPSEPTPTTLPDSSTVPESSRRLARRRASRAPGPKGVS